MNMESLIPFKVELVKPPESMRKDCPPAVWSKVCDLDYAALAGPWTAVGIANSEIYGVHLLLAQPGRMPEYFPRIACKVLSVDSIHLCPICNGSGKLACPLPPGLTSGSEDQSWSKECHGCGGFGWIRI